MNDVDFRKEILDRVTVAMHSSELLDLISGLPEDNEAAATAFCKRFGLGDWFWEFLTGWQKADLLPKAYESFVDALGEIANERMVQEKQAAKDREEVERDLRIAQGANS